MLSQSFALEGDRQKVNVASLRLASESHCILYTRKIEVVQVEKLGSSNNTLSGVEYS